ncbi:LamG domain-containing protein [Terrimonas pollutisoli]|uniref:LamG domain-containing protein n=1 Tax=Terrimonas pollutisoli TaxID=3034147 RepID=UPI0023EE2624|nr:LamG domain-containing protein [Terrimonas sp. H1YJ31]
MKKYYRLYGYLLAGVVVLSSCQKFDRPALGDFPKDDKPLPAGDLRFYVPFTEVSPINAQNMTDSISQNPSYRNNLTLTDGINGKALQGADGIAVKYLNANDIKSATSLTVAFWVKRGVNDRTELYFGLTGSSTDYWHQSPLFLLVEHGTATEATVKFAVDDKWYEFTDANKMKRPLLDGNWHHLAIVYDEATSKTTFYFDGAPITDAPASATTNGGQTGPLKIKSAGNMILGGWNKHVGLPGVTDDWVKSFTGAMDQFRLYNKALSATEVLALYNSKL